MNQDLKTILDIIKQSENLNEEEKNTISGLIKKVDNEIVITTFKLDRTEKVKRTTSILLEETIEELEKKREDVVQANEALKKSLEELKAAQAQLIHAEKMASLGELTAGIAHDLKSNLEKIRHRGQRASGIVKGMLEHSRTEDGVKEPTNLNALLEEYLRLAYHGLRAKDKSFNADFNTDFDESLPKINVVPQDIGRVILNLINNAFYAVSQKAARHSEQNRSLPAGRQESGAAIAHESYKPEVVVSTRQLDGKIEISVKDNGPGIPEQVRDKIFQPFFTTKPTGSGTGLGLSLSYDIVKAHGGELRINSIIEAQTEFIITLPQDL